MPSGLPEIVPAERLNMLQLIIIKVDAEIVLQLFLVRCGDIDMIIGRMNAVYMGPEQKTAFREVGDADARMVEGERFGPAESPFTIEEIAIADGQQEVDNCRYHVAFADHEHPNHKEKDDLDAPEEQVEARQLPEQVVAGDYQQEDIEGNEQ